MATEQPQIFISYAWEDRDPAKRLQQALQELGSQVWIDFNAVRGGDQISKHVSDALEACDVCLLVWSASARDSKWVQMEWNAAAALHKRIVPCRFDETTLPGILVGAAYIDFQDFDVGMRQLRETLGISWAQSASANIASTATSVPEYRKNRIHPVLKGGGLIVALGASIKLIEAFVVSGRTAKGVEAVGGEAANGNLGVVAAYLILLIGMLLVTGKLLASLPLKVSWRALEDFRQTLFVKLAPPAVIFVLIFTNYFPTAIVKSFYTERIFLTYISALSLLIYQILVYFFKPRDFEKQNFVRPTIRVTAVSLAALGCLLMGLQALTLIPQSIENRPDDWLKALLIFGD